MGLDVTLYKFNKPVQEVLGKVETYNKETNKLWELAGNYDSIPEETKASIRKESISIAEKLDLDPEYGEPKNEDRETINLKSSKYPEHLCKVGYLRSSYNSAGFNQVMGKMGLPDLYYIFDVEDNHEYYVNVNWEESLARAIALLVDYDNALVDDDGYTYDVIKVRNTPLRNEKPLPKSDEEAIKFYKETMKGHTRQGSFENAYGFFSNTDDWQLVGAFPGLGVFGDNDKVTYLITRSKQDAKDDWYRQMIEIVIENCEYVLTQPDSEKFMLGWSA